MNTDKHFQILNKLLDFDMGYLCMVWLKDNNCAGMFSTHTWDENYCWLVTELFFSLIELFVMNIHIKGEWSLTFTIFSWESLSTWTLINATKHLTHSLVLTWVTCAWGDWDTHRCKITYNQKDMCTGWRWKLCLGSYQQKIIINICLTWKSLTKCFKKARKIKIWN